MNIVVGLGLTGIVFLLLTIIWVVYIIIVSVSRARRNWHLPVAAIFTGVTALIFLVAIWLGVIVG